MSGPYSPAKLGRWATRQLKRCGHTGLGQCQASSRSQSVSSGRAAPAQSSSWCHPRQTSARASPTPTSVLDLPLASMHGPMALCATKPMTPARDPKQFVLQFYCVESRRPHYHHHHHRHHHHHHQHHHHHHHRHHHRCNSSSKPPVATRDTARGHEVRPEATTATRGHQEPPRATTAHQGTPGTARATGGHQVPTVATTGRKRPPPATRDTARRQPAGFASGPTWT